MAMWLNRLLALPDAPLALVFSYLRVPEIQKLERVNRAARDGLRRGRDELWRMQFDFRGLRRPSPKARRWTSDLRKSFYMKHTGKTYHGRFKDFFVDEFSLLPRMEYLLRNEAPVTKLQKMLPAEESWPINKPFAQYGGTTVVNLAARWSRNCFVAWLVKHRGADVNIPDDDGFTALCYAAFRGNLKLVRWLVRHVEDLDIDAVGSPCVTSSCGGKGPYTADVWALRKGFHEIVDSITALRLKRKRKRTQVAVKDIERAPEKLLEAGEDIPPGDHRKRRRSSGSTEM